MRIARNPLVGRAAVLVIESLYYHLEQYPEIDFTPMDIL